MATANKWQIVPVSLYSNYYQLPVSPLKSIATLAYCLIIGIPFLVLAAAPKTELKVAVSGFSGIQREALLTLASDFTAIHPDINVNFVLTEDTIFKDRLNDWLTQQGEFDLVIWHAGERLKEIARRGHVLSVQTIWEQGQFDNYFSVEMRAASSFNGEVYGIPISTYQWGFYYNRTVFSRFSLTEPENWNQFILLLKKLKSNGIVPIALASGSGWPVAGWYEYLNLRLNGIEAQTRLNNIQQDINEKEVRQVLRYLKTLTEAGYFTKHHQLITWKSSLPAMFRGQVAMTLSGNFLEATLPSHIARNIGYFPFPEIEAATPDYEIAPTDILLITQNSQQKEQAALFLKYVAQPAVQEKLNRKLNQISPNKLSGIADTTPLAKEGVPVLTNAAGLSQYFDREVSKALSDAYITIWADFIDHPDIDATIRKMQQIRENLRTENNQISGADE